MSRNFSAFLIACALPLVALAQNGGGPGGSGPGGHHGPPKEALDACSGKSADAACSFTHDGHSVSGKCFTPASDKPLACRPEGGPPGGPRGGSGGGQGGSNNPYGPHPM